MKNVIKRILLVSLFIIIFFSLGKLFRYILINDVRSYTRVTYHEMYEQDNIDVLFVGSSHCYRSFIPELLDQELGCNTFNAGSSSQGLDGSYLLIKEADRYNELKHVYLEVFYYMAYFDDTTQKVIISDYLKPSLDKYLFLYNGVEKEDYMNAFVVSRRGGTNLVDFSYIINLIDMKNQQNYVDYSYDYLIEEDGGYMGKGYVADYGVIYNNDYFTEPLYHRINIDEMLDKWEVNLLKIIDYCEENNIPLTLVCTPMSNYMVAQKGNYDTYINYVNSLIEDTSVDFYDFNLCREEYFDSSSEYYYDAHHLNDDGAQAFSKLFSELVNGTISEEELFYDSYEEKLNLIPKEIFGIMYEYDENSDKTIKRCKIITNLDEDTCYKITVVTPENETILVKDYTEGRTFDLNDNLLGECVVEYYLNDELIKQIFTIQE